MRRVMIIGQPGSGKSYLARKLGEISFLPVVHIDHIHWKTGWVERPRAEKTDLCAQVHARPEWIFEGGHSVTWPERLERADTLIWLDVPLVVRAWRVLSRTVRHLGRSRPDLPEGCPEHLSWEFITYIWRTRRSSRAKMRALFDGAPEEKARYRLTGARDVRKFLASLKEAVSWGNLGIPHR